MQHTSRADFRPSWTLWGVVTLWWTIDAWIAASQVHSMREAAGESVTWSDALIPSLASAWLWIPLTMLALWMAARYPVERDRWLPVGMHVLGALLVSVLRGAAVLVLNPWIGWYATIPPLGELFGTSLRNNVLIYWLLVGVGHGVHYARAVRAQREQLAQAQLHVLKSQLQPHFLFNVRTKRRGRSFR